MDVIHHAASGSASFGGLQRCGSVWNCPVCAAKIAERRKEEVASGVAQLEAAGRRVVMVTYTVRHGKGDDLKAVLAGLLRARRRMRSGRWAREWQERFGVVGSIRALEVTHGANGWHPHVHELLVLAGDVDEQQLQETMRQRWLWALGREGLSAAAEIGLKISFDLGSAEYLAKFGQERGWGPEHELTRLHTKESRGGRSPWQLLGAYSEGQDQQAGALFVEYAGVFKGQRQLWWSKGLKAACGLVDKTDEELVEEEEEQGRVLVRIRKPGWKWVVGNDARANVLDVAATGDAQAVGDLLRGLGVPDEWWWYPPEG